jgi:hypothetical protein
MLIILLFFWSGLPPSTTIIAIGVVVKCRDILNHIQFICKSSHPLFTGSDDNEFGTGFTSTTKLASPLL